MSLIREGISISLSFSQLENADSPISIRLSGRVIFSRLSQSEKAPFAMDFTPSGIMTSVNEPLKLSIPVTLIPSIFSGTETVLSLPRYPFIHIPSRPR